MTEQELFALIQMALRLANTGADIYSRLGGRDLTADELAELNSEQESAELNWADTLQKMRDAAEN